MTGHEATRTLELEHALEQAEQRLRLALGDRMCDLMREKHYHRSYQIVAATRLRNAVDRAVGLILEAARKDGTEYDYRRHAVGSSERRSRRTGDGKEQG